jgi:hypothetical protein
LVKENWATIDKLYGESSTIGRIISAAAGGIASEAHAEDVEAFFTAHAAPRATEDIKQMLEGIRQRAKFRARNAKALEAYFNVVD